MKIITIGIDSGSQNTKGALLVDGKIIAKAKTTTQFDANSSAHEIYDALLKKAKLKANDVASIAVTGTGRDLIKFGNIKVNEVDSAAKGAHFVKPDTQLVIDMGAESSRVIQLKDDGSVQRFELNEKCASGAGIFIEAMARAIEVEIHEIGQLSLRHTKEITTNSQCVVFAESEVVTLIHQGETKENIAYGIHKGICNRLAALVRRIGIADNITMIGGPGNNAGLIQCIGKTFDRNVFVPEDTDYISAVGASVFALENIEEQ